MKKSNLIVLIAFVLMSSFSAKTFAQTDEMVQNPVSKKDVIYTPSKVYPKVQKNDLFKAPITELDAVNVYAVTRTTGITYTPIAGNTISSWRSGSGADDNLSNAVPIGFSFVYNGVRADSFLVGTGGFITFNINTPHDGSDGGAYSWVNSTFSSSTDGATLTLAPIYYDLDALSLNNMTYLTTGAPGSRILTVQFANMAAYANATPNLNFQIKIYESDGHIEFVYGSMNPGTESFAYTCGINGPTISATPTAAELSTQQTDNTNNFSATPQNALATVPATNTMLAFTTPVQTAPASPTTLTFTGTSSTTTTLNWVDASSNETGFPVYISTNNVDFNYLGTAPANTTSIQVTGLSLNTQYFFQVWASNETKYSASSANGNVTTLNLSNPMSGAYTINPSNPATGTNYQTFSQADTALFNRGISGPVVFTVSPGTYAEQSLLGPIIGSSSSNTIKFVGPVLADARVLVKPVGTAATNDYAIALIGSDYVTYENIDVEDGGTTTSNQIEYGYYIQSNGTTDGATNNTINGARIKLGGSGLAPGFSHGVLVSNGTSSNGNNGNSVLNCTIDRCDRGIAYFGLSAASPDINTVISNNVLGSIHYIGDSATTTTGSAIGIITSYGSNAQVNNNIITNVKARHPGNTQTSPIGLSAQNSSGNFYNNKISNIINEGTSSTSRAIGISGSGLSPEICNIYNNFISNLSKTTVTVSGTMSVFGIRSTQQGGAGVCQYFYNTIYLSSALPAPYTSGCFGSFGGGVPMVVYDNILINNISTSSATARSVAIQDGNAQVAPAPSGLLYSNFNDLYAPGTNGAVGLNGSATYRNTLADWRNNNTSASLSLDTASSNIAVNFVNSATNDLHLTGSSIGNVSLLGDVVTGIDTDIDGDLRGVKPYMGADQATGFCTLTLKFNTQSCPSPNTFTIELRNTTSPYAIVESKTVTAGGNIASAVNFSNAVDGTPYYVVVKSVNAIETWSATGVTFVSKAANYDFTTNVNKAFGSNQVLSGGIVSIYQGDANQDGFVNSADILIVYNNAISFTNTPATDFNCDGVTDVSDIILGLNNSNAFVQVVKP
ncbi:MAG TPA: hypothetical protein PKA90_02995 [Ignavibacteria bacterium]|nr:hypothetical protein [Ignavibacteria bacterium]HMR39376.1 hypothetical protein [Ignavibacteria bacterium]